MTEAQLRRRVDYWQRELQPLGLGHWRLIIAVADDLDNDDSDAEVQPHSKYDHAHITVHPEFLRDADVERIDNVIVHELLHVVFRDLEQVIEAPVQLLGAVSKELVEHQLDHELEGVIERLARTIIAQHER